MINGRSRPYPVSKGADGGPKRIRGSALVRLIPWGSLHCGGTWVKTKDGEEKTTGALANRDMVPTVFIGSQMERCLVCHYHLADPADVSQGKRRAVAIPDIS